MAAQYLIKVGVTMDNSDIKNLEKKMDKSFKGIATRFGKNVQNAVGKVGKAAQKVGKVAAIGGGVLSGLGIIGGIANIMMNPLNTIKAVYADTLSNADEIKTNSGMYNSQNADYAALKAYYEQKGANADNLALDMDNFARYFNVPEGENVADAFNDFLIKNKKNPEMLQKVFGVRRYNENKDMFNSISSGKVAEAFYKGYGVNSVEEYNALVDRVAGLSDYYDEEMAIARQKDQLKKMGAMNEDDIKVLVSNEAKILDSQTSKLSQTAQAVMVADSVLAIQDAIQGVVSQPLFAEGIKLASHFIVTSIKVLTDCINGIVQWLQKKGFIKIETNQNTEKINNTN